VRNRFFEQEFYDLQRVEVLRGPQGTLYGRNATAGVVNIISQKPKFIAEAKASGDVSNYNSTRIEGMINIPLVEDIVALRLAGAWTKRNGYVTNEISGNPIDGRDLWSTRVSLRFAPNDAIDVNLIWEHFEEDDDRLRSGKQLCKKDVVTEVGGEEANIFVWQFVPDSAAVLFIDFDGALSLVDRSTDAGVQSLGLATTIQGISRGTYTAIVERLDVVGRGAGWAGQCPDMAVPVADYTQDRMQDEMHAKPALLYLAHDGIDQERHVVVENFDDREIAQGPARGAGTNQPSGGSAATSQRPSAARVGVKPGQASASCPQSPPT